MSTNLDKAREALATARTKLLKLGLFLPTDPWGKPRLPMPELEDFIDAVVDVRARAVAEDVYAGKAKPATMPPLFKGTHPSHKNRFSDASSFDEICDACGAADQPGDDGLSRPCPAATSPTDTGAGEDPVVSEMRGAYDMAGVDGWVAKNQALRHGWERIADLEQRLADAEAGVSNNAGIVIAERMKRGAAERERDKALASLEAMERRVGELEGKYQEEYRAVANAWKALDLSEEQRRQFRHIAEWVTGIKVERDAAEKRVGDLEEALRKIEQQTHWTGLYCSLFARAALTPDAGTARSDGEG